MNLNELDRYKLSDAVKFNARLNPKLWGRDEHLKPEVREALMKIAEDFRESLGVKDLDLKDITLSGSNAAYTYTPNSDIDLHLVVRMPNDPVYRELFDAKKYAYNNQHNIKIGGYDVELYVQDEDQPHVTQGEYSLIRNDWIQVPRRQRADVVDRSTRSKYQDLKQRIKDAVKTEDHEVLAGLMTKIKQLRQSGLDKHGEFGPENLAFKMLRTQGYIKQLVDARNAAKDQELSLDEQQPKKTFKYGFGSSSDAGDYRALFKPQQPKAPATNTDVQFKRPQDYEWYKQQQDKKKAVTSESSQNDVEQIINQFAQSCIKYLGIEKAPEIKIHADTDWSEQTGSFGQYDPDSNVLHLATSGRHTLDILRTMAHEFTHRKQAELETLPPNAGETGSRWEDEANAMAGRIMRYWAEKHPEMFAHVPLEEASGYIPTKKQARDPRFIMALTKDVRPGQTGKEANKLGLQTDAQGHPALLTATLKESLAQEYDRYGNEDPPGPEFKPTMPAGTVKVDVSDVYDWYKLGQHIANMKGLGKHDFGAGPPSTIISFGDEETEHKYIKDLEKTGLTTTDIDPVDPKQPPGMPRQKVDPTYNVDESFDQPYPLTWERGESGVDAYTKLPDGTPLEINFSDEYDDEGNEITHVEFHRSHSQNVTGEGDAQRIFATVLAAIQQFIQSERPKRIMFGADKEPGASRAGLYTRLVDRFAKPLGYQVDTREAGTFVFFDLTRRFGLREEDLAESLHRELQMFENQDLFEINMSTSNLRREAAKTGAIAGMEFEMIVPNTENDDYDDDMEPDYDYDERCRSIDDAYQFFYDGDYNSRRSCENMRDSMRDSYTEWIDEKILDDFGSDGEDYIREWVANNVDESEWNPDDLEGDARSEALDEYAANIHADPSSDAYNQAFDEYREENQENWDESDWLDDADLDRMSAIEDAYSMTWPYWQPVGGRGSGEASIADVAQEFENAIGRDVRASDSYHSGATLRPSPTQIRYVVEPDGSLEPDNPNDRGLEFVSPPLPIDEILSDLNKVKAWAKEYGCYTNDSTGLHINISVPDYSRENLDFVKLALLMGDKYVLDAFGRSSNTYAKSAMGIIKDAVRNKPEDAARLLDKMKGNLDQLATKAIHSGVTSKYTSINTKDGHIEFRSPGGDWLDENFDKIENTLLRFTVAMSAALNPEAYRQEYLTKLYKLLSENNKDDDTIKYFSDYVAGKIPKAALRSFVKQAQLERRIKRGGTEGQKMWWAVSNPPQSYGSIEVVASSKEEAIERALGPDGYPSWANTRQTVVAKPLRPYTAPPAGSELERIERQAGVGSPTLNGRPSNPDGNYVIVDSNNDNKPAYRFMAAGLSDAITVLHQWEDANPGTEWSVRLDTDQTLGQPTQSGTQGSTNTSQTDMENRLGWPDQTGDANYEIVDRRTGRRVFVMVANTEYDARRKYADWCAAARIPIENDDYEFRAISRQAPGRNYEIYRGDDRDDIVAAFVAADDQAAQERLERYRREHPGGEYRAQRAPVPGSTMDIQRQRQQAALAQQIPEVPLDIEIAPPRPLGAGRELIGWSVRLPNGEEVTQIHGIGNSQGDANRIAAEWLRQNGMGVSGEGFEVVPLWREA